MANRSQRITMVALAALSLLAIGAAVGEWFWFRSRLAQERARSEQAQQAADAASQDAETKIRTLEAQARSAVESAETARKIAERERRSAEMTRYAQEIMLAQREFQKPKAQLPEMPPKRALWWELHYLRDHAPRPDQDDQ